MVVMTLNSSAENVYHDRLNEWTKREIQLSRLHEELVAKRETLVHYSMTYVESQLARRQNVKTHVNTATIRNTALLEDLESTEDRLYQEACNPPSPRLTTLQNNYWSMVKSLKPLWEQSLQKKTSLSSSRKTTGKQKPSKPKRVWKRSK
ncbi:centrosomal protein 15-like [Mytilus trossulus]|uniref:centrosomal protein 15-like n=1 Tax=Mytilus trossulus TaxID=6551 RepID=UPI0030043FBE